MAEEIEKNENSIGWSEDTKTVLKSVGDEEVSS